MIHVRNLHNLCYNMHNNARHKNVGTNKDAIVGLDINCSMQTLNSIWILV